MIIEYDDSAVFFVYIITNKPNGVLYIGYTNNIKQRMYQHKKKTLKGFSKKYNLDKLVYFEVFKYPTPAIRREKQMKKWRRQWKINLINGFNPDWKDLCYLFQ